jgi:hypothetical protein
MDQPQNTTPPVDFNISELPEPPDSCPISELIGKRMSEMDDAELEKHLSKLRTATESPQNLRKNLLRKGAPMKAGSKRVDLSILGI